MAARGGTDETYDLAVGWIEAMADQVLVHLAKLTVAEGDPGVLERQLEDGSAVQCVSIVGLAPGHGGDGLRAWDGPAVALCD